MIVRIENFKNGENYNKLDIARTQMFPAEKQVENHVC